MDGANRRRGSPCGSGAPEIPWHQAAGRPL